jgi:hypothetical protein
VLIDRTNSLIASGGVADVIRGSQKEHERGVCKEAAPIFITSRSTSSHNVGGLERWSN